MSNTIALFEHCLMETLDVVYTAAQHLNYVSENSMKLLIISLFILIDSHSKKKKIETKLNNHDFLLFDQVTRREIHIHLTDHTHYIP